MPDRSDSPRQRNWAGNHVYRARRLHEPTTIEALRDLVASAPKLRVLGSRHAFNDIVDTDGDLVSLARSEVLSSLGLARVPLDLVSSGQPVTDDVSVGELVARRLGREVVERLVDPLLGGVYAGRADLLSLQATLPQLVRPVARSRSLLRAMLEARSATPPTDGPLFASLPGGLGRLPAAVAPGPPSQRVSVRIAAIPSCLRVLLCVAPVLLTSAFGAHAQTVMVSRAPDGRSGDSYSVDHAISADGRFVVFVSATLGRALGQIELESKAIALERRLSQTDVGGTGSGRGPLGTPLVGMALLRRDPMLRTERSIHKALDQALFHSMRARSLEDERLAESMLTGLYQR